MWPEFREEQKRKPTGKKLGDLKKERRCDIDGVFDGRSFNRNPWAQQSFLRFGGAPVSS